MTLNDLESLTRPTLTPAQAASVLGCNPDTIRWMARVDAAKLGFPVIVAKSRTYIPRLPFIAFLKGDSK